MNSIIIVVAIFIIIIIVCIFPIGLLCWVCEKMKVIVKIKEKKLGGGQKIEEQNLSIFDILVIGIGYGKQ